MIELICLYFRPKGKRRKPMNYHLGVRDNMISKSDNLSQNSKNPIIFLKVNFSLDVSNTTISVDLRARG